MKKLFLTLLVLFTVSINLYSQTDITSYSSFNADYYYTVLEFPNSSVLLSPVVYTLKMPDPMLQKYNYKDFYFDIKVSDDWGHSGAVNVTFTQTFKDGSSVIHTMPVTVSTLPVTSGSTVLNVINSSMDGSTFELIDKGLVQLTISFTQVTNDAGTLYLVLRGVKY